MEKLSPMKSQNLVRSSLPKSVSLFPPFFLVPLQLAYSPTLAGVKLPLFCQFWQQQHVPQIRQCVSCRETIIGSLMKSLRPDLRDAKIEVGTKRFFN